MIISRRHFLRSASAALSAAVLAPAEGIAGAVRDRRMTRAVPLSPIDEAVLAWVRTHATATRLAGAGSRIKRLA